MTDSLPTGPAPGEPSRGEGASLGDRLAVLGTGKRILALTNRAAALPDGSCRDALESGSPSSLVLLAPEHGLGAARPPGRTDTAGEGAGEGGAGPRVLPFYLVRGQETPPLPEADLWVYDLPLVGARYFTYLDGLRRLLLAAGARGQAVHVVDRPNPLGLEIREGPGLTPPHRAGEGLSEVACLDLPVRYALSTGEVARFLARVHDLPEPVVLSWEGEPDPWSPGFLPPSPNLPTLGSLRLYPALCLLEGLEISLGRGTRRPFQWFGAPGLAVPDLLDELEPPPGVEFRPRNRTPEASRCRGRDCPGIDLLGTPPRDAPVLGFGLRLLRCLGRHLPGGLPWVQGATGRYWLDTLWGGSALREALVAGDPESLERLAAPAPLSRAERGARLHPRAGEGAGEA